MTERAAAKPAKALGPPHYLGHRARLRQRFMDAGADTLPEYELLELVLFRAIPRGDVKAMSKQLLKRFGSLAEVVAAPAARLAEIKGVGEAVICELKLVGAVSRGMLKGAVRQREALTSWAAVIDYCRAAMAFQEVEEFRVLFLDKRNCLIADEVQGTGTVDHTPVYPREVVKRALELSSSAVILVHNHPSGDPTPSSADIRLTQQIIDIAKPLGVAVHDHLIIGRNGHASFKGLQLI